MAWKRKKYEKIAIVTSEVLFISMLASWCIFVTSIMNPRPSVVEFYFREFVRVLMALLFYGSIPVTLLFCASIVYRRMASQFDPVSKVTLGCALTLLLIYISFTCAMFIVSRSVDLRYVNEAAYDRLWFSAVAISLLGGLVSGVGASLFFLGRRVPVHREE